MTCYLYDEFNGTGDLSSHTADIGGWIAPTADLDDQSRYFNTAPNDPFDLSDMVLTGTSGLQFRDTWSGARVPLLAMSAPPELPDYRVTLTMTLDPTVSEFRFMIGARTSPGSGWTSERNFVGVEFAFDGSGNLDLYAISASDSTTDNTSVGTLNTYSAGMVTISFVLEIVDRGFNVYLDDGSAFVNSNVYGSTFTDATWDVNGEVYFGFKFDGMSDIVGDLHNVTIGRIQVCPLATVQNGEFWQDFVLTHEIDP